MDKSNGVLEICTSMSRLLQPCKVVTSLLQGCNMVVHSVQGVHNLIHITTTLYDSCDKVAKISKYPTSNTYRIDLVKRCTFNSSRPRLVAAMQVTTIVINAVLE